MQLGLYKTRASRPWYGISKAAVEKTYKSIEDEVAEEEKQIVGKAVTGVVKSTASSSHDAIETKGPVAA